MMNTMMKITMAAAAFALVAGAAQSQDMDNFYKANIDVDNASYASHIVNPGYWLINWSQWADVDSRWTGGGYIRLGVSSFQCDNALGGGVPEKYAALAYAKAIGADVVIYATTASTDTYNWTSHYVAFYAKQNVQRTQQVTTAAVRRPTSAEATAAANRANDVYHQPHVVVHYDAQTDTYNWIGPTTGQPQSKPASWFLDQFGAYLSKPTA
jgi:hypothetical protein